MLVVCTLTVPAQAKELSKPKISTVSRTGKGKTTIKWSKNSSASGYEIEYSNQSDFSDSKTVTVKSAKTVSKSLSDLSTSKDTYFRVRAYKTVSGEKQYSDYSGVAQMIAWKKSWKYAKNSKIHSSYAVLYYSTASDAKGVTIAVNAGHGTKGGSSQKTLCHPDGSAKVTGGTTAKGEKYAVAVSSGTDLNSGESEASVNLKVAKKLKEKLLEGGYNVLMLRENSDTQLDNVARTVLANQYADAHVAIHFDSTNTGKGAFYISVPDNKSYRAMKPVKSHWKQHNALGKKLIKGLKSADVKICKNSSLSLDLTQTSYSTIPSVDIEVGDKATSTSDKNLSKIAKGLYKGIQSYFD